jgi:hypothetical protein
MAILENDAVAEQASEISHSWIGPETFVGSLTRIEQSLAWGSHLINWKTSSWTEVPDAFLLCSLSKSELKHKINLPAGRFGSLLQSGISRPIGFFASVRDKLWR